MSWARTRQAKSPAPPMQAQGRVGIRVGLVVTGLERGGAELQVVALAGGLRARAWDVAVLALRMGPLAGELVESGIPVYEFRPQALLRFRPQILHAHLFHANIAARVVRLFFPIPVVISTVHSIAESSRRSGAIRHRDFLYRLTGALSDADVFVSRAAADRHRARGARVIPNGVDTARFRPDPERRARTRAALGLTGEFVWLAAGRLMWKKNYPLLLEAMTKQRDSLLLIAGDGPETARLRELAPKNVRFLGARSDVPELMNAADGFVLSSLVEGLPAVLLEAAASGLPCVATAVGGVAEAVRDGVTGYVVAPGDAAALAAAMSRIANEPREEMSRAAREFAVSNFDLPNAIGQWERLYRELLWT
jgi:glycosyltransferase involved in cell wall biosynthesis